VSFAEAKALASGDPLVLDKATADADLARLERPSRAHQRNLSAVSYQVQQADRQVDRCDADLDALEQATARTVSTRGADFRASIAGAPTIDRSDAADLLRTWAAANLTPYGSAVTHDHPHGVIAHLGGHDITATEVPCARGQRPDVHLSLAYVPRSTWVVTRDAMTGPTIGVLRQMENHAADVPQLAPRVRHERAAAEEVAAEGRAVLQRPFKYAAELATAREKVREINTIVAGRRADTQQSASVDGSQPAPAFTERISRSSRRRR